MSLTTRIALRALTTGSAVLAVAVGITATAPIAAAAAAAGPDANPVLTTAATGHNHRHLCAPPGHKREMSCHAIISTDPSVQESAIATRSAPPGYGPADLRSAYGITSNGSASATIAIVDAYDDPKAESDLAVYRTRYGLPACTSANQCFRKIDEHGGTHYPSADTGWAGEISLDLDMASAICPGCHILLVEAASDDLDDLGTAVNAAVAAGAKYISNSYGGSEDPSDPASTAAYFNHPGVVITVSAGDSGYGVEYPASTGTVTSVGGTSLVRAANARGWSETVWSTSATEGTGSGCSAQMAKPSWQTGAGCPRRTVADVAAVADPDTGVAVYDSYGASGWNVYGGTSAAAPIIAAIYALAGVPGAHDYPAAYPYQHPGLLWDVTSGANGSCGGTYLCTARLGYDGPTGLGSPDGVGAFRAPTATTGATATAKAMTAKAATAKTVTTKAKAAKTVADETVTATAAKHAIPTHIHGIPMKPSNSVKKGLSHKS